MFIKRFLLVIVFLIMAFYGFRTEETLNENRYSFLPESEAIRFEPHSVAYTESFPYIGTSDQNHLSMEMSIKPDYPEPIRFGIILQIYDKSNDSQICVGQWDRSLVILDSDDYSNSKRLPKIYAAMALSEEPMDLSILSGPQGTSVYINGELIKENASLFLKAPINEDATQLIIGNGIFGLTPWEGSISSLKIFSNDLQDPILHYDFSEIIGKHIPEESGMDFPLLLPDEIRSLKKDILRSPQISALKTGTMEIDIFFNFFGFIPLGILIFLNFPGSRSRSHILPLLVALGGCFLFSLSIEITQVWLPGRDSSTLDLILNTTGGLVGSLVAFTSIGKQE